MRKVLFTLLATMMGMVVMAQENKFDLELLEKIVETKLSKSTLVANAQQWASSNDPTCKKKIEVLDKENGSIIVKIELNNNENQNSLTNHLTYKYKFSLKIDCKDNKYRRVCLNPSVLVGSSNINPNDLPASELEKFIEELEAIERISVSSFQEILDWEIEKVYQLILSNENKLKTIEEQKNNLGESKKDKKAKKRLEKKAESIIKDNTILYESIRRWNIIFEKITNDIDKTMNTDNNF